MQPTSDAQLLRDYAEHGAEAAFAEIIARHTDLVYSAALRQVYSPDLARDVTQSVLTDLARKARTVSANLSPAASLVGWLYRGTRFAARDLYRKETRRTQRERQAKEQLQTDSGTGVPPVWLEIAPHLDAALEELDDTDRDALLLRYFKNHDLRTVGATLGISDDAAQKRVSRAVERLREFFAKRGVTVGAGGLAVVISANAVQAAPVGLALTISTAAVLTGTTLATTATITATKAIAMTALQKTLVTATLVILAGAGIYEARQAAHLRDQVQMLQQQQAEQIQKLQRERDEAMKRLASLTKEVARNKSNSYELLKLCGELTQLKSGASDSTVVAANALLDKVNKLKQRLEQTAGAKIPELELATEQDWLETAGKKLDTDIDYRRAMAHIRTLGKNKVAGILYLALNKYFQENDNQFPSDIAQLKPYLTSPLDDAILQAWGIVPTDNLPAFKSIGKWVITENSAVDSVFDSRHAVAHVWTTQSYLYTNPEASNLLAPVVQAFSAANNGAKWSGAPSALLPYAKTPEEKSTVQNMMLRESD